MYHNRKLKKCTRETLLRLKACFNSFVNNKVFCGFLLRWFFVTVSFCPFAIITDDSVWQDIFMRLPEPAIAAAAGTCRRFRQLVQADPIHTECLARDRLCSAFCIDPFSQEGFERIESLARSAFALLPATLTAELRKEENDAHRNKKILAVAYDYSFLAMLGQPIPDTCAKVYARADEVRGEFVERASEIPGVDVQSHRSICVFPLEFAALPACTNFTLNRAKIDRISPAIGELSSLEELSMKFGRLSLLPEQIGRLSSLSVLDLGHNKLAAVPQQLSCLTALQVLDLRYNRLKVLPDLGALKELGQLRVDENRLTELPDSVTTLVKLEILTARHNCLRSLPEQIGQLTALKTLELYGNSIARLPESLSRLTQFDQKEIAEQVRPKLDQLKRGEVGGLLRMGVGAFFCSAMDALEEVLGDNPDDSCS